MVQSIVARTVLAACLVAVPLAGQSEDDKASVEASAVDHKAVVLERIASLEQALRAWSAAVDAGEATFSADDIVAIRDASRGLEQGLGALSKAVVPEKDSVSREKQEEPAATPADTWARALLSTDRSDDFERTLAEIEAALNGDDEVRALAGLRALTTAHDVALDRARFREGVLRWFENGESVTRLAAAYALGIDQQPGDLARIQSLWPTDDDALRASLSHLLMSFGKGTIEGRSEEIVLALLAEEEGRGLREVLRGLWGAQTSDIVQARLVALEMAAEARGDFSERHNILYFGLSTSPNKNAAVVDRLLVAVTDPDHNNSGRALWGLGYGISSADDRGRVAEALISLHNTRVAPALRHDVRRLVELYGTPHQVDQLN